MKFILLHLFLLSSIFVSAQIVTTFAGIPDSIGNVDGPAEQATFNNPHGMAVGIDGTLYISDRFNHTIRKITPEGLVSTIAGAPGISGDADGNGSSARFYEPWGLAVDTAGVVYVADTRNNKIKKITTDGTVTTYAGTGSYGISNGPGNVASFGFPTGIEVDQAGNVFVADHNTHIIRKINIAGFVSTIAGVPYILGNLDGPANTATFNRPYGLTLDNNGNIFIADEWNHKIRKLSPDGQVTTVAGKGTEGSEDGIGSDAAFRFPWDITIDHQGNIYVADGYNYAIRRITAENENYTVNTYTGNTGISGSLNGFGNNASFQSTTGIAFSSRTKELFVADAYNDIIRRVTSIEEPVEIRIEEGAALDCPEERIAFSVYPQVFEAYEFYVDNQLAKLSSEPYFDTINLSKVEHTIKVIPYYDLVQSAKGELTIERYQVDSARITPMSSLLFFEGDSVRLRASEGIEYFWSTGDITSEITLYDSNIVHVEIIDSNQCVSISNPVEVTKVALPLPAIISLSGPNSFCLNSGTYLSANYEERLQWYQDGWAIEEATERTYLPRLSGDYFVEHTLENGLKIRSETLKVEIFESPILSFYASATEVRPEQNFNLRSTSQNVTNIYWMINNDNFQRTIIENNTTQALNDPGYYDVILIGENGGTGCMDTLVKENYLHVFDESELPDDVFVANIFTPNNDGNNDWLYARGLDLVEIEFSIFTKEGQLVFKTNDKSVGWDGRINGASPLTGNYSYLLRYVNRFGTEKVLQGKLTLYL